MARIEVSIAGKTVGEVDPEGITLKEAFTLKAATGLSIKAWTDGIAEMDPAALQSLVWLAGGRSVPIESIDFKISDLGLEMIEAPKDEDETPSGTSVTDTSEHSPSTAT